MRDNTEIAAPEQISDTGAADPEIVAVTPGDSEEATLNGASDAGPRVDERAEARQHRDARALKSLADFNAADITTYEAFVDFLRAAGFARAFAKKVTNRQAFAAEPAVEDSILQAFRRMTAALGATKER